jgi:hypothetical protein
MEGINTSPALPYIVCFEMEERRVQERRLLRAISKDYWRTDSITIQTTVA